MLEKIKKTTWYNLVNNLKDILEGLWNKPAGTVTWDSVEDKPTTFTPTIGTTATTAKAGNYTPSATEVVAAFNAMTPEQIEEIQLLLGVTP